MQHNKILTSLQITKLICDIGTTLEIGAAFFLRVAISHPIMRMHHIRESSSASHAMRMISAWNGIAVSALSQQNGQLNTKLHSKFDSLILQDNVEVETGLNSHHFK